MRDDYNTVIGIFCCVQCHCLVIFHNYQLWNGYNINMIPTQVDDLLENSSSLLKWHIYKMRISNHFQHLNSQSSIQCVLYRRTSITV